MADIELVIKISEEKLSMIKNKMYCGIYDAELYKAIENGIKLPKGHGRIIDESKIMIGINNAPTIIDADKGEFWCGTYYQNAKGSEDCRDCKEFEDCPCGKDGHESGTSQGYSIGECKDFEPQSESEG